MYLYEIEVDGRGPFPLRAVADSHFLDTADGVWVFGDNADPDGALVVKASELKWFRQIAVDLIPEAEPADEDVPAA